jgi:hypothetical protein
MTANEFTKLPLTRIPFRPAAPAIIHKIVTFSSRIAPVILKSGVRTPVAIDRASRPVVRFRNPLHKESLAAGVSFR